MTEVLFYHLQRQPLERVLPQLAGEVPRARLALRGAGGVRRARARRSTRICGPIADDSFLPHGTDREAEAARKPVVLTTADGNPNTAHVRFLVDGARRRTCEL